MYTVYDKPWRTGGGAADKIYRPSKNLDKDIYGDDVEKLIKTNKYVLWCLHASVVTYDVGNGDFIKPYTCINCSSDVIEACIQEYSSLCPTYDGIILFKYMSMYMYMNTAVV